MFTFYPMISHLHRQNQYKKKENVANNYKSLVTLDKNSNIVIRGKVSLTPQALKNLETQNVN